MSAITLSVDDTDETAEVQRLIDSAGQLERDRRYRCERELRVWDKNDFVLDFNGASVYSETAWWNWDKEGASFGDNSRTQLDISGGSNVKIINPQIFGPQHDAYTYIGLLAKQHGIAIKGTHGCDIVGGNVKSVYGDGVYLGIDKRTGVTPELQAQADIKGKLGAAARKEVKRLGAIARERKLSKESFAKDVTIRGSRIERVGRQIVAMVGAERVTIEDSYLGEGKRSSIDIEPNSFYSGTTHVNIRRVTFGPTHLGWFTAAGYGAPVTDVLVEDCDLQGRTAKIRISTGPTGRRERIRFDNIRSDTRSGSTPLVYLHYVDGFEMSNFQQEIKVEDKMQAVVVARECRNIFPGGIEQFPGARELLDLTSWPTPA